jgi:hypothetical protein
MSCSLWSHTIHSSASYILTCYVNRSNKYFRQKELIQWVKSVGNRVKNFDSLSNIWQNMKQQCTKVWDKSERTYKLLLYMIFYWSTKLCDGLHVTNRLFCKIRISCFQKTWLHYMKIMLCNKIQRIKLPVHSLSFDPLHSRDSYWSSPHAAAQATKYVYTGYIYIATQSYHQEQRSHGA